jgi:hypothetical protein
MVFVMDKDAIYGKTQRLSIAEDFIPRFASFLEKEDEVMKREDGGFVEGFFLA